jgi:hypothetical protein
VYPSETVKPGRIARQSGQVSHLSCEAIFVPVFAEGKRLIRRAEAAFRKPAIGSRILPAKTNKPVSAWHRQLLRYVG